MYKRIAWIFMSLVAACSGPSTGDEPDANGNEPQVVPVLDSMGVDILFVIDTSSSMAQEQENLAQNFDRFMAVMDTLDGWSSRHIAVVSTDLGAGPYSIGGCADDGDGGVMLSAPQRSDCTGPDDAYLREVRHRDGTIENNFDGTLSETFSCIAQVGAEGCEFEQPLEAMYRALNGSIQDNAGFLRENAYLLVVFITDEDDCSVFDQGMFDPAMNPADRPLESLSALRCFEHGVRCSPDTPNEPGAKADCQPRQDSLYLYDVTRYVDFLKGLKADPSMVVVAGVAGVGGAAGPVEVVTDIDGNPELAASCQTATGTGLPAVRLGWFLDQFPERNTQVPICDQDHEEALRLVSSLMAEVLVYPCLNGDLRDSDGDPSNGVQPGCTVTEVSDGRSTALPACDDRTTPSNAPCYVIEQDPACSDAGGLSIHAIHDELEPALPGATLEVVCPI